MSRIIGAFIKDIKCKQDLKDNTYNVLRELEKSILTMNWDTAKVLLFWLNKWSNLYLPNENDFDYSKLMYYKRGSIINIDLGFKVGSEQGGLHYGVVVENDNAKYNKTIIIIPLGSLKQDEDPKKLDNHEVFLGYDLFDKEIINLEMQLNSHKRLLAKLKLQKNTFVNSKIRKLEKLIKEKNKELQKYKCGSIAIISQMCTVSKMRIENPKYEGDKLSQIKLDPQKMGKIDEKVFEYFIGKNYKISIVKDIEKQYTSVKELTRMGQ